MDSYRKDAQFVDMHRVALIQRVSTVMTLVDRLLSLGMLGEEMYADIHACKTSQEKMRELFKALNSGGDRVKSAFYCALRDHDPHLMQDLASLPMDSREGNALCSLRGGTSLTNDLSSVVLEYKEAVRFKYKTVEEYNSLPGERVLLADRYTDLLIVQTHRGQSEREEEIRSKGQKFQQVFTSRASEMFHSISLDQLFAPDGHGDAPKAVILQGSSGHGKSFTVQKIMCDWASGDLLQEFDFVFHLNCKELNHSFGEKSVVDLLSYNQKFASAITNVLQNTSQKVLFLIDGFDELRFSLEDTNPTPSHDPFSQAPVEATVMALLKGNILPESSLLVTTRSSASYRLGKLLKRPQSFTEILGFSQAGVKEFFQRFFKDGELSNKVYGYVRENETLFTACFIPVICWIVCTVFREQFKTDINIAGELETTTSIFVHFVFTLLDHHCQGLKQSAPTLLKNLGQLAEMGMLEQQVLFDERTVFEVMSDPTAVPFLCKFLLKRKISLQPMFSFMHLSFQEFFAALLYILTEEEDPEKIKRLLSTQDHLKTPHLFPIIQFLFGLSNMEVSRLLKESLTCSVLPIRTHLEEWILSFIQDIHCRRRYGSRMFILHCLYELHEEDFVRRAMLVWEEIDLVGITLTVTDCWVLLFCLQCCPSVRSLKLIWCNLTVEKLRMLQPALCRCKTLKLQVSSLTDDNVADLVTSLGKEKNLSRLELMMNSLSDESIQLVLASLCRQKCLGSVSLLVKAISSDTAAMILQVLQKTKIKGILSVEVAEQMDSDVKSVCAALSLKNQIGDFKLCVGHHSSIQNSIIQMSLVLPLSEICRRSWSNFFQIFHTLQGLNEGSQKIDQNMDALFSFLSSMTGLKRVDLIVGHLTIGWATWIFSLMRSIPLLEYGIVEVYGHKDTSGESLCTSLHLRKQDNTFSFSMTNGSLNPVPTLSHISLTFMLTPEVFDINWESVLKAFHSLKSLKEGTPVFNEQVDTLLSFPNSVSDLKTVKIEVSCLTSTWAERILYLIQNSSSLQELTLVTDGCLLEEGLQKLQVSTKRPDCVLLLQGQRCYGHCNGDQACELDCNQQVKIQIIGDRRIISP